MIVRADEDGISQIVVNLLSNAEKYSMEHKEIDVALSRSTTMKSHAELTVQDRGSGVPRGQGVKIFEKFYRANDALDSSVQGSGLGLSIAQQIARALGGELTYAPRSGGGSCFTLRLPLVEEAG